MICFCHVNNSFNKEQFYKYRVNMKLNNPKIYEMLEKISGIKYDPNKKDEEDKEYEEK